MEYDNENTTNSKILSGYVALFILVLGGLSGSRLPLRPLLLILRVMTAMNVENETILIVIK